VNLKINLILRSVTATNSALAPDDKEIYMCLWDVERESENVEFRERE
jgi:hypothetical protein